METLVELAITSFIVGFTGAMMPGPVLIATILYSTKKGYMAGPLVTLGHALVELIVTVFLAVGLVLIIGSLEARVIISLLGGLALLWMGYEAIKYSKKATMQGLVEDKPGSRFLMYGPVFLGLLMSVSNPYWWVWWAIVGNTFITEALTIAGIFGAVIFYFSHIMSDFTWYTMVSSSIGKGRMIISDKVYKYILAVCAVSLVVVGVIFIAEGAISALTYIW